MEKDKTKLTELHTTGTTPDVALFQQIKNYISARLDSGEYSPGAKIPSEAELGELFNTSRMTVNRALRELAAEGRITRQQGRGSFAAEPQSLSALFEVKSIAEEIREKGGAYSCYIHLLNEEPARPTLAEVMGLEPYAPVYHSIMVHMNRETPIQLADRYVHPIVAPDYLQQDFSSITANQYLRNVAPIIRVAHTVEAVIPEAWIRELLQINHTEPCLALQRTTWTRKLTATRSTFYYPGSRYRFSGHFEPFPNRSAGLA
jgi:GntR family transcriptional regulator, histidine utilization repressor